MMAITTSNSIRVKPRRVTFLMIPLRLATKKTVTRWFVTEVVARSGRLGTACLHERLSRNGRTVSPGP